MEGWGLLSSLESQRAPRWPSRAWLHPPGLLGGAQLLLLCERQGILFKEKVLLIKIENRLFKTITIQPKKGNPWTTGPW